MVSKHVNFGTFDTESLRFPTEYGERQQFYIGDIYYNRQHFTTTDLNELINKFKEFALGEHKVILYAHNLKYDLMNVGIDWAYHLAQSENIPFKVSLQNPVYMIIGNLRFVDSFSFYSSSLRSIVKEMFPNDKNLQKYWSEEDYALPPQEWNAKLKQDPYGVKRDTEILYHIMKRFHEVNKQLFKSQGVRYVKTIISLPQLSFKLLKGMLMNSNVLDDHEKEFLFSHKFRDSRIIMNSNFYQKTEKEVKTSYKGGRTEALILVKEQPEYLFDLDVNSLYPFVMKENLYPTVPTAEKTDIYIADVTFECSKDRFLPVMEYYTFETPVLTEVTKKRGMLTSVEIEYMSERGCKVTQWHKVWYFEAKPLFRDFINLLNSLKEQYTREGKKVERNQVKKIMNSSYGKWGMHKRRAHIEERPTIASLIKKLGGHMKIGDVVYTKIGETLVSYLEETDPIYSLPIASFVTAYARVHIHHLAERVGYENVFYMDTDSLFLNEDAYHEAQRLGLTDDVVLGKLKLEKEGYFKIYGKKYYIQIKDGQDKDVFTTEDFLNGIISFTIKGVSKSPKTLKYFKLNSKTGELEVKQIQSSYYNREIQFKLVEKHVSPKPRLKYIKEGKYEIGYALSP